MSDTFLIQSASIGGTGNTQINGALTTAYGSLAVANSNSAALVQFNGDVSTNTLAIEGKAAVSFNGSQVNATDVKVAGSGDASFNTALNATRLTQSSTGTTTLGGTGNNYVSNITVSSGNVVLGKTDGSFAVSDTLAINGGKVTAAADQQFSTWSNISVGSAATLDLAGFAQTVGTLTGSGLINFGAGGTGSLLLASGCSSFSGQLLGAGELVIGLGASFTLGASFSNTNLNITLAGGTLNLAGYTGTLGNLNITANSIIDFGSCSSSILDVQNVTFANSLLLLTINSWTSQQDFLYAQNRPGPQGSAPMNQIVFSGFTGNDTRWQSIDHQITPVPEPSTYGALLIATGLACFGLRRWRRAKK